MVLDTSAVIAIIFRERERTQLVDVIARAASLAISAASVYEAKIVAAAKKKDQAAAELVRDFVRELAIHIAPVDADAADHATAAYLRFGRGYHPAALNFGDCFAYALAKARVEPLLFKGEDFCKTDIVPAWRPPAEYA